jgi:HAD domain in Swiss Army Knife RNA repair proteins
MKPLLLIDVDGVISLFGFDHAAPPQGGRFMLVDGIAHFLSVTAGEHLRRLETAFELAWCTGWEEKANDYLPLALGLDGPLPHVVFDPADRPVHAHWKLGAIDLHVEPSRPVAWIDDAHDDACLSWAAARSAPTLLVTTDPAVGLTEVDVERLLAWAGDLGRATKAPPSGAADRPTKAPPSGAADYP